MFDWRDEFNESERAEIDAASPYSIMGRMVAILDRLTRSRSDHSSLTVDFSRHPKRPSTTQRFEE